METQILGLILMVRWWQLKYFSLSPLIGEMIQFDGNDPNGMTPFKVFV